MRLPRILPAIALFAALSACSDSAADRMDAKDKSMEKAKAEARELQRPEPGQYTQKMTITEFTVPGAPPEMVEQLKGMMTGQAQETSYCLTKADADKGFEEMFKKGRDGDCSYDKFDVSGGDISAVMSCKPPTGGTATMTMEGSVRPDGSEVKVKVKQEGSKQPMGNATIAMEMETKRTGDCTAADAAKKAG